MKRIALLLLCIILLFGTFLWNRFYAPPVPSAENLVVPFWMEKRIGDELAPYSNGITLEDLALTTTLVEDPSNNLLKFEIIDNKLYASDYSKFSILMQKKSKIFIKALKRILEKNKVRDVSFVVLTEDFYQQNVFEEKIKKMGKTFGDIAPIFINAVDKRYKKGSVLFVDEFTLGMRNVGYWAGWNIISQQILKANRDYPWEKKKNLLFWRGKVSDKKGMHSYREDLVKLGKQLPNKIDAVLSGSGAHNNIFTLGYEILSLEFSWGNFLSKRDQVQYKMLLNIDGYTCTYPGYLWRLLSNSVTFKQDSYNEQWFYDALKPWEHYVPVNHDLSDIVEKIDWVLENDHKAKLIADNSTNFVKDNLMPVHVDLYIVTLLNKYADLQKFTLHQPSLPEA